MKLSILGIEWNRNFSTLENTVNSRYSGHLRDVVLCPEKQESVLKYRESFSVKSL